MFSVLLSPESWGEVNGVFAQSVEWVHKDIEKKVCGNFRDHPILVRRGFSAVPCSIDNTVSDRWRVGVCLKRVLNVVLSCRRRNWKEKWDWLQNDDDCQHSASCNKSTSGARWERIIQWGHILLSPLTKPAMVNVIALFLISWKPFIFALLWIAPAFEGSKSTLTAQEIIKIYCVDWKAMTFSSTELRKSKKKTFNCTLFQIRPCVCNINKQTSCS